MIGGELLAPITRMLLKVFTYRQIAITGGLMVGIGYVYCGLFAASVVHLFVGYIFSGMGHTLTILPLYLALQEQFLGDFPTASSATSLFQFVGMSTIPILVKTLKDMYGVSQTLLLLGAIMWNLVACGVAIRIPRQEKTNTPTANENQSEEVPPLKENKETKPNSVREEKEYEKEQMSLTLSNPLEEVSPPKENKETKTNSVREEQENEREKSSLNNDIKQQRTFVIRPKWFRCFSSLTAHTNFAFVLIFLIVSAFCLSSWFIFLVSHGKAQGLTSDLAVLLTTAGGVGGLIGKITGTVLFHFRKMTPYVCCFPFLITGLAFLISAYVRDGYAMFGFTLLAGFTQGLSTCGINGSVPLIVCKYHLPQAFALLSFVRGLTIQCSGLFAGLIYDTFGSSRYVFCFNAILCFLVSPLMFLWVRNEQIVKQCRPDLTLNRPISEDKNNKV